jgi:molybdenum cofactor biosynthesis enzyme MoaA
MKAQNLTVCLPNEGCNKKCPYCVSRMTHMPEDNHTRMLRNGAKVYNMAKIAGVTSVLLTSKGETTMDLDECMRWIERFKDFPVEIQTNGRVVKDDPTWIVDAVDAGLDIMAVSIDNLDWLSTYAATLKWAARQMVVRLVFNMTIKTDRPLLELVSTAKHVGAQQVIIRRLTIPEGAEFTPEGQWIAEKAPAGIYDRRMAELRSALNKQAARKVRSTAHGVPVYSIGGTSLVPRDAISVVANDYCVQERSGDEDIRSLIFHSDGHLYTSWNDTGSILF